MRKFPTFLKALPEFYGLSFSDMGTIMGVLYLSLFLKFNPLISILLCAVSVMAIKFIRKNFDLIGWMLPRRQSLLMKDVKRGIE